MKLSASACRLGLKARKTVPFPTGDQPLPAPVLLEDGTVTYPPAEGVILVDVRCLDSTDRCEAIARATAYAKAKGVDPVEGNTVYDIAVMAEVCALACVDHESPVDRPEAFFDGIVRLPDGSIENIGPVAQAMRLGTDHLAILYQAFQMHESEANPRRISLTPLEVSAAWFAMANAEDRDERPFVCWPPVTQQFLLRTLARRLLISPSSNSSSTTDTAKPSPT